jgi:hypothetical protein
VKRWFFLFVLAFLVGAGNARAQVVAQMSQFTIDQALASGSDQSPVPYSLRNAHVWLQFDTPFLRTAMKAAEAQQRGAAVDRALATPDVLSQELRVVAGPEPRGDSELAVKAVFLEGADGSSVAARVETTFVDYAQSWKRKKIGLRGVRAVLPISALTPGSRFRVVLNRGDEQVLAPEPEWFTTLR